MQAFMDDDFLLGTDMAKILFYEFAVSMPIIDYHCHINPREIAENRRFENITQAWLEGDHYKWRLMRANGAEEKYITGSVNDREKFQCFAEALEKSIGNPVYHWAHLELRRYFECDTPLSAKTAEEIWQAANQKLSSHRLSVRGIIEASNVRAIATTDDPAGDLAWHRAIMADKDFSVLVIPTFRPDKAVNVESPGFSDYIRTLGNASGIQIDSLEDLYAALASRLDFFADLGCRASDHGLNYVPYRKGESGVPEQVFKKALAGGSITEQESEIYKTAIMLFLGRELSKRNMVMQLHYGVARNVNTSMYKKLGPDTGYDCIGLGNCGDKIFRFMDELDQEGLLPRTILYSINPNDNMLLDTIAGCFQGPCCKGKIQHGSAWWFNDTKDGMIQHLKSLANTSTLGNFIGMLTDSRSFLSYTRHEYFRRILCSLIGEWVENGEYPNDIQALGQIVKDISYYNTARYFRIE